MEGLGWGDSQAAEARPALACIAAPSIPGTVPGIMSTIGSPVLCRERDNVAPNTSLERTPRRGPNLRKACYCGEVEERRRSARGRSAAMYS